MKRWLLLLALPVLALALSAGAEAKGDPSTVLPSDQTINGDYFARGGTVDLAGTVTSDAYVAGGTVTVSGTINGDLLVAGGTVTVSGHVLGNMRVAGGTVLLSGTVDKNVTAGGGTVDLTSSGKIGGNVVAAAGTLGLDGQIGGSVKLAASNADLAGTVGGNVDAAAGQLHLTSKVLIGGNLNYTSRNDATIDQGATVSGNTSKHALPERPKRGFAWPVHLWQLLSDLGVAALLFGLFPRFAVRAADAVRRRPWPALGIGLATLLLTPVVIIIVAITLIGLPVAFIMAGAYALAIYLSKFISVLWLTNWWADRSGTKLNWVWLALAGVAVLWLVELVPILGPIVAALALLFGLGGIVTGQFKAWRRT